MENEISRLGLSFHCPLWVLCSHTWIVIWRRIPPDGYLDCCQDSHWRGTVDTVLLTVCGSCLLFGSDLSPEYQSPTTDFPFLLCMMVISRTEPLIFYLFPVSLVLLFFPLFKSKTMIPPFLLHSTFILLATWLVAAAFEICPESDYCHYYLPGSSHHYQFSLILLSIISS